MAFNPALPANNSVIASAELRAQFTGLKSLIDAVPSSPAMTGAIAAETQSIVAPVGELTLSMSNPPTTVEVTAILNQLITTLSPVP